MDVATIKGFMYVYINANACMYKVVNLFVRLCSNLTHEFQLESG